MNPIGSNARGFFPLSILALDAFSGLVRIVSAQNVAITTSGIAIATQGGANGLLVQDTNTGSTIQNGFPSGVGSFDDLSIDADNERLVFALSVSSRTVCSYEILDEKGSLGLRNCAGSGLAVVPFTGVAAAGGNLVVSGGTGGLSLFEYNPDNGDLNSDPLLQNFNLNVIGLPDVIMVNPNLAAFSTDFSGNPRFGSLVASIDGGAVTPVREFRVEGTLGFQNIIQPANFPIVNAVLRATDGNTYMYTAANGPMTVQDPTSDNTAAVIGGAPDGSVAVTVAVNGEKNMAVFGLLQGSLSLVLLYDISSPLSPSLVEQFTVDGRITSIASTGNIIAYILQNGANIIVAEISMSAAPTMSLGTPTMSPGTSPPSITAAPIVSFAPTQAPAVSDAPAQSPVAAPTPSSAVQLCQVHFVALTGALSVAMLL